MSTDPKKQPLEQDEVLIDEVEMEEDMDDFDDDDDVEDDEDED